MKKRMKPVTLVSQCIIWAVVIILTLSCLLPLLNMVAISFSGSDAVAANQVGLIPKDFNVSTYQKLLGDSQFWRSFLISVIRVVLGTLINMFFTVTMAYPLSKSKHRFHARDIYMKIVIFAMLFNGGIIPLFMVVSKLHMINTIWALVLPGAVPVFNVILLVNFFKGVPESLDEAARIDGCNEARIFWNIIIPTSKPIIVYTVINSFLTPWMDFVYAKMILNAGISEYYTVAVGLYNMLEKSLINSYFTIFCCGGVLVSIPISILFFIMQKFYVEGITAGAVKG